MHVLYIVEMNEDTQMLLYDPDCSRLIFLKLIQRKGLGIFPPRQASPAQSLSLPQRGSATRRASVHSKLLRHAIQESWTGAVPKGNICFLSRQAAQDEFCTVSGRIAGDRASPLPHAVRCAPLQNTQSAVAPRVPSCRLGLSYNRAPLSESLRRRWQRGNWRPWEYWIWQRCRRRATESGGIRNQPAPAGGLRGHAGVPASTPSRRSLPPALRAQERLCAVCLKR